MQVQDVDVLHKQEKKEKETNSNILLHVLLSGAPHYHSCAKEGVERTQGAEKDFLPVQSFDHDIQLGNAGPVFVLVLVPQIHEKRRKERVSGQERAIDDNRHQIRLAQEVHWQAHQGQGASGRSTKEQFAKGHGK